jgi:hypothetical protein
MSTRLASAFALVLASNCTTAPQPQHEPEVVGAWLPIARGPAVLVAARLDDLLGDPPRAWHEPPRTSRRAEVDVVDNAVRWRGSAEEVRLAAHVLPQLDRAPDHVNEAVRFASIHLVCRVGEAAEVSARVDSECRTRGQARHPDGSRRCTWEPSFATVPESATSTLCLQGLLLYMIDMTPTLGWLIESQPQ